MPKGKRSRPGWARTMQGTYGGCGAQWTHVSNGWKVIHCGHPTANYPYYGDGPNGEFLREGGIGKGRAFRYLTDAQIAVELLVNNASEGMR